jgi:hypothetical protein
MLQPVFFRKQDTFQGVGRMNNASKENQGLHRLIRKFRNEFRRPENANFYSEADYKVAERKYIKHRLNGRMNAPATQH